MHSHAHNMNCTLQVVSYSHSNNSPLEHGEDKTKKKKNILRNPIPSIKRQIKSHRLWFTQTTIWFPWISKDISAPHSFECLCCWTALAVMNCRTQALSFQTTPLIFMPQGNGWKEKSTDSSESGKLECSPELPTSRDNMFLIDRASLNTLESQTARCYNRFIGQCSLNDNVETPLIFFFF